MGWYGDYKSVEVEADVRPDGTYNMFPNACGNGYKPQTQEERAWRNHGKIVHSLFDDPESRRWRRFSCNRMAPLIAHFNSQRGEMIKGRVIVRAEAFKPYERWAWEVRDVKYFMVSDSLGDAMMFKLACDQQVEMTLQHFMKQ